MPQYEAGSDGKCFNIRQGVRGYHTFGSILLLTAIQASTHPELSLARAVVKAPKLSHITPILKSLHWLKVNERVEYRLRFSLSLSHTHTHTHIQDSLLLNLLISITWSLFSLLGALVRHLSSQSLVHPHLPLSKSQIVLSVMHHPVFGIIFLLHALRQPRSSSITTITPSITSSLFHSRLKTHLFHKSSHHRSPLP